MNVFRNLLRACRLLVVALLGAALFLPGAALGQSCTGRFVNPLTDVCWECLFPISIGAVGIGAAAGAPDTPNPPSPLCYCGTPIPRIGLSVGMWEPARLIDVSRTPFCFSNLGGLTVDPGRGRCARQNRVFRRRWRVQLDMARPLLQPAAVAEHEREQPHHADPARLLGEVGLELRKIHLGLFAGGGLEAMLEAPVRGWTDVAQIRSQLRVAARVTQLAYLAQQARGPNPRIRLDPFAQVRPIRVQQLRPRRPRTVARRLQSLLEVLAHGLAGQARLPCDRRDR